MNLLSIFAVVEFVQTLPHSGDDAHEHLLLGKRVCLNQDLLDFLEGVYEFDLVHGGLFLLP